MSNPSVTRAEARAVMAELRRPATAVRIKRMKEAYTAFLADQQIAPLAASLQPLLDANAETSTSPRPAPLSNARTCG